MDDLNDFTGNLADVGNPPWYYYPIYWDKEAMPSHDDVLFEFH